MKKLFVGIDFGHGETAAWLVSSEIVEGEVRRTSRSLKLRNSTLGGDNCIKSVVYSNGKGDYQLNLDDEYFPITELKGRISCLEERKKIAYQKYIALIIDRLIKNNNNVLKWDPNEQSWNFNLHIACPTRWGDEEMKQYLEFFRDTLASMDKPLYPTSLIRESDAAYYSNWIPEYMNKCILVIDYGSSTVDYTVIDKGEKMDALDSINSPWGASFIERNCLRFPQDDKERENFTQIKKTINQKLTEYGNDGSISFEDIHLDKCREAKEIYYKNGDAGRLHIDYSYCGQHVDYKISLKDEDNKYYKEYKNQWKEHLIDVKKSIEKENVDVDKVILSGSACQMPWVRTIVEEVFGSSDIDFDEFPQFVVAKGVTLYAETQDICIDKIKSSIEDLEFDRIYSYIWKEEVYNLLSGPIKETCNNYKNAEENSSIRFLMESIEQRVKKEIEDKNNADLFIQAVQKRICNNIKKIVEDIIKKKFCKDSREVSNPMIDTIDILPLNSNLYERMKKATKKIWLIFSRNEEKPQQKKAREDIAQKAINSWEKKGRDNLNICSGTDDELKKISSQMKEVAMKCAIDTFYKNELFKTTFTDASHS